MSDLNWFFRNPRISPSPGDTFSQLYLLRRDIDTCFGINPDTGTSFDPVDKSTQIPLYCKAIWPGTMAVLAGIDLLSKFFTGNDKSGGKGNESVEGRFKSFINTYLEFDELQANILYQLRNSLLHSFGLYSELTDRKGNVTATYNFILSQESGLIAKIKDDFYEIDVQLLRTRFEQAISKYEDNLRNDSLNNFEELNNNFNRMFPKHAKPMSIYKIRRD